MNTLWAVDLFKNFDMNRPTLYVATMTKANKFADIEEALQAKSKYEEKLGERKRFTRNLEGETGGI